MSDLSGSGEVRRCCLCGEHKPLDAFYRYCSGEGYQSKCKVCDRATRAKWANDNPDREMLRAARHRAKKEGLPFSLSLSDIHIPERCPIATCGVVLVRGGERNTSPSLDKVVPPLGYIKGNVVVICQGCNFKKNNSTAEELYAIADYIYRLREERGLC